MILIDKSGNFTKGNVTRCGEHKQHKLKRDVATRVEIIMLSKSGIAGVYLHDMRLKGCVCYSCRIKLDYKKPTLM